MNWVDYFVLGIFVVSALIGLFRGFLKEVMGLVVWGAAFVLAFRLSGSGAALLEPHVDVPSARVFIAFGLVFLVTLLVGGMINYVLGRLIVTTGLDGTDRMLGIFFGLGRALILLVALVFLARLTPVPQDPWWQQSSLLPHLTRLADWSSAFLPREIRDWLENPPSLPDAALLNRDERGDEESGEEPAEEGPNPAATDG